MPNFALVNMRGGIRRDVESFLPDNDSFPILENAYLFRGRIEKRTGVDPVGTDGRLKLSLGNTGASPFTTNLLDATVSGGIPVGVASFRIGSVILTDPGGASPVNLLSTDPTYSGTLNRATGALSIAHPVIAATPVIYVPGIPVMGFRTLEQDAINDEGNLAFDTRWTYLFDVGTGDFILKNNFPGTANQFVWTGQNYDQFWSTNYFKAFWATNNNAGFHAAQNASPVAERDGIRWYGLISATAGWRNFNPAVDGTNFLNGGLLVLPYKNRLVVLNTLEGANLAGTTRFPQRARWCQNGTPFYGGAGNFPDGTSSDTNSWRSDVVGKGGFVDAPTSETIVSAEFIKDTLVVYFERSTWQLFSTGNPALPFAWQKINTELGCESSFSIVPFDSGILAIGNYGIISTDSVSVLRIDQKIPDEVFQIQNINQGVQRVSGIRDYNAQLAYFSYPVLSDEDDEVVTYSLTFPNQVLVYNYLDGSWAEFDDCFTCFGYFQEVSDTTWAQMTKPWNQQNTAWNSQYLEGRCPEVVGGNQRGFCLIFSQLRNVAKNSPTLPISDINTGSRILSCPDHNLTVNQYIQITDCQGVSGINDLVYKIVAATVSTITIDGSTPITGTYTGGGLITHIPNIAIRTKEFNPWYEEGKSVRLSFMDIFMDRTTNGEITAQFYTSDNDSVPVEEETILTSSDPPPTYTLPDPNFALSQKKVWHRVFSNCYGSFVQNVFTMSDAQMKDLDISTSDITIQGLIYYFDPCGRISYDL